MAAIYPKFDGYSFRIIIVDRSYMVTVYQSIFMYKMYTYSWLVASNREIGMGQNELPHKIMDHN